MPELFDVVDGVLRAGFGSQIIDDDEEALPKQQATPVTPAAVVAGGIQEGEMGGGFEGQDGDVRFLAPAKGAEGNGLIEAVDAEGIVGGGATKPVAPAFVADIGIGAGVDE